MRLPQVKRHLRTHATTLRRERQSCPSVANGLIFPGNSLNMAMAVYSRQNENGVFTLGVTISATSSRLVRQVNATHWSGQKNNDVQQGDGW